MSKSVPANSETKCCVCEQAAQANILCESCASGALKIADMVPEQILMSGQGDGSACLVDAWGRIYGLGNQTTMGRDPDGFSIAIHQASISRNHARIDQEPDGSYSLIDLKSTNGSHVGNTLVQDKMTLASGDLIFVGSVGFYFLCPRPSLRSSSVEFSTLSPVAVKGSADDYKKAEVTDLNDLESVAIEIIEATGGGGGFVDVAGTQVQISMVQLELMKLLMKRMERDRARPAAVRGYLHSSEILAEVSWDTAHPSDNHVKQLVRRLRRSLARSGRDNLVESQQGLGYRLSVRPTSTTG
jgi:hypothetical protein